MPLEISFILKNEEYSGKMVNNDAVWWEKEASFRIIWTSSESVNKQVLYIIWRVMKRLWKVKNHGRCTFSGMTRRMMRRLTQRKWNTFNNNSLQTLLLKHRRISLINGKPISLKSLSFLQNEQKKWNFSSNWPWRRDILETRFTETVHHPDGIWFQLTLISLTHSPSFSLPIISHLPGHFQMFAQGMWTQTLEATFTQYSIAFIAWNMPSQFHLFQFLSPPPCPSPSPPPSSAAPLWASSPAKFKMQTLKRLSFHITGSDSAFGFLNSIAL